MGLDRLAEDFALLDDWEERYRHVIELGRELERLPPEWKTDATKVRGCASQVWLKSWAEDGPEPILRFRGESDAQIVQGLIRVLIELYSGRPAGDIVKSDPRADFEALGLLGALSAQRSNGLFSMAARIKADAARLLAGETL
ncbi:MAG: SufE family protein [Alphaproteobacteria bacterium]|nr:SufE family protein [Alphaproteobacteria bacterium]